MNAAAFSNSGVPVPRPFRFLDARNFTSSRKRLGSIVAEAPYAAAIVPNGANAANEHSTILRAARASERSSSLFGMVLIQLRGGQRYLAAAIFAGIMSGLLIIDFVVDDIAQARPIHAPYQTAPVDEQRGSRAHGYILAQRLGFVHFRFGFLVIH